MGGVLRRGETTDDLEKTGRHAAPGLLAARVKFFLFVRTRVQSHNECPRVFFFFFLLRRDRLAREDRSFCVCCCKDLS